MSLFPSKSHIRFISHYFHPKCLYSCPRLLNYSTNGILATTKHSPHEKQLLETIIAEFREKNTLYLSTDQIQELHRNLGLSNITETQQLVARARGLAKRTVVTKRHKEVLRGAILAEEARSGSLPTDVSQLSANFAELVPDIPKRQLYTVLEKMLLALGRKRITREQRQIIQQHVTQTQHSADEIPAIVDELMQKEEFRERNTLRTTVYHLVSDAFTTLHRHSLSAEHRAHVREYMEANPKDARRLSIAELEQKLRPQLGDVPSSMAQQVIREERRRVKRVLQREEKRLLPLMKRFVDRIEGVESVRVTDLCDGFTKELDDSASLPHLHALMTRVLHSRATKQLTAQYRQLIHDHIVSSECPQNVDKLCAELQAQIQLPLETLRRLVQRECNSMERRSISEKYRSLVSEFLQQTPREHLTNVSLLSAQVQTLIEQRDLYIPRKALIYKLLSEELIKCDRDVVTESDSRIIHKYLSSEECTDLDDISQICSHMQELLPHLPRRTVYRLVQQERIKMNRAGLTKEQRAQIARYIDENDTSNKSTTQLCDGLQKQLVDVPRIVLYQIVRSSLQKKARAQERRKRDGIVKKVEVTHDGGQIPSK